MNELDEAFQKFMMPMLQKVLAIVERIEKTVNKCDACYGVGSWKEERGHALCAKCNGVGYVK